MVAFSARRAIGALVVVPALVLGALMVAVSTPAVAIPNGITTTVDSVLVNKTGGITVFGTMDCTAEVSAYYGGSIPANVTVGASTDWTAYQPAGRKTMIQASFASNHLQTCFNNNPSLGPNQPLCGGSNGPCQWLTSNYGTAFTPFYVYSPNGRFKTGAIHVDLQTAGYDEYADMFNLSGFDLNATRAA